MLWQIFRAAYADDLPGLNRRTAPQGHSSGEVLAKLGVKTAALCSVRCLRKSDNVDSRRTAQAHDARQLINYLFPIDRKQFCQFVNDQIHVCAAIRPLACLLHNVKPDIYQSGHPVKGGEGGFRVRGDAFTVRIAPPDSKLDTL